MLNCQAPTSARSWQPFTALRQASELRAQLDKAFHARSELEAAVQALQKHGKQADADAVRQAASAAEECGELLAEDVSFAQEALQKWSQASASQTKLDAALSDGASPAELAAVIQVEPMCLVPMSPGCMHCEACSSGNCWLMVCQSSLRRGP